MLIHEMPKVGPVLVITYSFVKLFPVNLLITEKKL